MKESNQPDPAKLTIAERIEIDRQCMDFDQAWQASSDQPPSLIAWLDRVPQRLRTELFRELLKVEIEYRASRGLDCDEQSIIVRFPEFAESVRQVLRMTMDTTIETEWNDVSIKIATQQAAQLFELAKQFEADSLGGRVPDLAEWVARQAQIAKSLGQTLKGAERQIHPAGSTELQRLGDFQIIRQIGRGGMGAVFEAEQLSLHRRVALKVLWFAASSDQEAINRFAREATTIANLHHTNIVPIFAVGNQDGVNYYAMQLIDGNSLDKLSSLAPFVVDADRVVDWGLQAAEALTHAHERGIVHRDIKPSNLMLDQSGRLWLTDFGLAKSSTDQTLSLAGAMLGTPRYMSPEQASTATHNIDHRSDIYSLGATLYELLAGRPVFDGDSPVTVIQQILSQEPTALDKVQPNVPRDLSTIVMKCLNKDRIDRYSSARDLAQDLRSVSEGRPIRARRTSKLEIAGKWLKRHQTSVRYSAAVVAAITFVLIGLAAAWSGYRQYHTARVEIKSIGAPVVTAFLDSQGERVGLPITLPTQASIELPSKEYILRASTAGLPSLDYSLALQPRDYRWIELDLGGQRLNFPMPPKRGYRVLAAEDRALIVSWSETELNIERFRNSSDLPSTTDNTAAISLAPLGSNPAIKFVTSLGCDLDGDGYDEVLICLSQQSALRNVSRSRGFVWHQVFGESPTQVPDAPDDNLFPWIRGEILQPPMLVPDQDGDGKQDLLVSVGQNPREPRSDASLVQRFISLVSAVDGHEIWRHNLANADFELPDGSEIHGPLQWHLADPWSSGSNSISSHLIRNGRNLRHLDRKIGITAPHVEAQQVELINVQQQRGIVVRTGTRIRMLDVATGVSDHGTVDTGVVSAVPFAAIDLDADGTDELLMIESLAEIPNPNASAFVTSLPQSRLVAWSLGLDKPVWSRTLEARVPIFNADQRRLSWPIISKSPAKSLLIPNGVSHAVGYQGESLPWSSVECLRPDRGEAMWSQRIANCDSWTDQFTFGADLNGDWVEDVLIASMWGSPLQLVTECRCGASGDLLWLSEETLAPNTVDSIESVDFLADAQRFQVVLSAPNKPKLALQFDVRSGQLKQSVDEFERLVFADVDGDRTLDWCLFRQAMQDAETMETLTIARGNSTEQWRILGEPVYAASDFDGDSVTDLLVGSELYIRAISGKSGTLIWQYATEQRLSDWRFYTWDSDRLNSPPQQLVEQTGIDDRQLNMEITGSSEASSGNIGNSVEKGRASFEAWDVDQDGVSDVVVQMGCNGRSRHVPFLVLSGKSGKRLWQCGTPTNPRAYRPPLQCLDLDGDGRLEILSIDQFTPTNQSQSLGQQPASSSLQSVLGASLWEVGGTNPEWTTPISFAAGSNNLLSLDRIQGFEKFPQARLIKSDDDEIADLILLVEKTSTGPRGSELFLTAVSGADGNEKWSNPLNIKSFDQRTLPSCDRVATCDLDQDGRDEILYLSFENRMEGVNSSRRAVLQAMDVRNGSEIWKYERVVPQGFLSSSASGLVAPIVLRSTTLPPLVALNLRDSDNIDVVTIVTGNGELQGEYPMEIRKSYHQDGFPCWVGDCNGDGNEELLFDDGELKALQVFGERKCLAGFGVRAAEPDVSVRVVHAEDGEAQVWASNAGQYWVAAFKASSGKLLWKCQGDESGGKYHADLQVVQILSNGWSPHPNIIAKNPVVVFNGYYGVAIAHRIADPDGIVEEMRPNPSAIDLRFKSSVSDWRLLRPLPWASSNNDLESYAGPSNLAMFIGFVLLCSFLLVVLPILIVQAAWRRWISHLAALLCLSTAVPIGWLFFSNPFQIPFMEETPSLIEKITLGFQYAPLWLVIAWVPNWLFNGRWILLVVWTVVVIGASSAVAAIAITESVANAPLSEGERFDLMFSPMILLYGVFIASWLGLGLAIGRANLKRVARWTGQLRNSGPTGEANEVNRATLSPNAKTGKPPIVPRYIRTLYLAGLTIWIGYVSLFPNWQGSLYLPELAGEKSTVSQRGSFGLQESNWQWPVWDPPRPGGLMSAKVRWPWQAITADAHIEVDFRRTLGRLLNGFVVIGLVLGIAGLVVRREQRDPALIYVWSISLSLVVVWMVALFLEMITWGALPNSTLLFVLTGSGFAAGIAFGRFVVTRPPRVANQNKLANQLKSDEAGQHSSEKQAAIKETSLPRADVYPFPRYRWLVESALLLIGIIVGSGLGFLAITTLPAALDPEWVPSFGPGFGGPRPATMRMIGLLLVGIGLVTCLPMFFWRRLRSLAIGFFVAALCWGVFCLLYS